MKFDAIVVGAGPAGSASAIELARHGFRVALIEKSEFPRRKVCGEFISATSIPLLERFGVANALRNAAGPEVRRVGLFTGERVIAARMPDHGAGRYGRALGRDILDGLMRDAAVDLGVVVYQPCQATGLRMINKRHVLRINTSTAQLELSAPILIAAHGSWERSAFPCPLPKIKTPDDLLGFKAHFHRATMDADLMPLLSFPGGYGGMVWAGHDRLSLSCCVRRDVLERLRQSGETAAMALHRHLVASCKGIREVLSKAQLEGPWLAAGPIRPGIRPRYDLDIFRVGNAAGEAHPVIAEGISMALQSGWLLADQLRQIDINDPAARADAGYSYARLWRAQFSGRIRAAAMFSCLAMEPRTFSLVGALVQVMPSILTVGAKMSGKIKQLPLSFYTEKSPRSDPEYCI